VGVIKEVEKREVAGKTTKAAAKKKWLREIRLEVLYSSFWR
jgi:hypothetical protein